MLPVSSIASIPIAKCKCGFAFIAKPVNQQVLNFDFHQCVNATCALASVSNSIITIIFYFQGNVNFLDRCIQVMVSISKYVCMGKLHINRINKSICEYILYRYEMTEIFLIIIMRFSVHLVDLKSLNASSLPTLLFELVGIIVFQALKVVPLHCRS